MPNEALRYLQDRRDLGIHSDVITEGVVDLVEAGVVTGRKKSRHRDRIVASYCLGTRRLYDFIDDNPRFKFRPIDQVCHPQEVSNQSRMVSITQAFAIDLTGQICIDQFEGEFYGGVSTQVGFIRGAARIIGSACYWLSPTTNLAEVAFMVAPGFQGAGLGTALQACLQEYAMSRNVRGFVFEILPRNINMLRLAARVQGTITTSRDDDIVHVTALFPDNGNTSRSPLPDNPLAGEVAA